MPPLIGPRAAPSAWLPNIMPMLVPPRFAGVEIEQPRLLHRAHRKQKEAEKRHQNDKGAGLARKCHSEQHHHGHRHAADDDTLAAEPVGKISSDGRHGETGGLQGKHARADPFGRVAHLPGQVEREEREQRALRRRAERRAGGNHYQRSVLQQLTQVLQPRRPSGRDVLAAVRCVGTEIEPSDQY